MKPKTTPTKVTPTPAPAVREATERMKEQFATTGTVQGRDIAAVFGSPAAGFQVDLKTTPSASATWKAL